MKSEQGADNSSYNTQKQSTATRKRRVQTPTNTPSTYKAIGSIDTVATNLKSQYATHCKQHGHEQTGEEDSLCLRSWLGLSSGGLEQGNDQVYCCNNEYEH